MKFSGSRFLIFFFFIFFNSKSQGPFIEINEKELIDLICNRDLCLVDGVYDVYGVTNFLRMNLNYQERFEVAILNQDQLIKLLNFRVRNLIRAISVVENGVSLKSIITKFPYLCSIQFYGKNDFSNDFVSTNDCETMDVIRRCKNLNTIAFIGCDIPQPLSPAFSALYDEDKSLQNLIFYDCQSICKECCTFFRLVGLHADVCIFGDKCTLDLIRFGTKKEGNPKEVVGQSSHGCCTIQ